MDIEQQKKILREKIEAKLKEQGKNAEEHVEAIEKFLSTLPSRHMDNLMNKLEELEGENVDNTVQIDTTDFKNAHSAAVITQIRDSLQEGDIEGATNLAQSLHTV